MSILKNSRNIRIVLTGLFLFLMSSAATAEVRISVRFRSGGLSHHNRPNSNRSSHIGDGRGLNRFQSVHWRSPGATEQPDSSATYFRGESRPGYDFKTAADVADLHQRMVRTFRANLHRKSRTDSVRTRDSGTKYEKPNGSRGYVPTFKPTFVDTFKPTFINTFKPGSVGSRPKHFGYTAGRRSFAYPYSSLFRPIVSPHYRDTVCYRRGRHFSFSYIYPYYHRKHVFVCPGGYWPAHYRYIRYYWYGYYPYAWYGYYPQVYEVKGNTYNYYINGEKEDLSQIDEEAIAEAKERLPAQTEREPASESRADRFFEDGVKAFEAGNYRKAVYYFRSAVRVESDDIVLPFAYAQALFAGRQYDEAAKVLRENITKLSEEDKAVFYPRGLYPNDETLFGQIERLAARLERYPDNEELRFLLGYQYLGIGRYEEAAGQLRRLDSQSKNSAAAAVLLELIEKITAEEENS